MYYLCGVAVRHCTIFGYVKHIAAVALGVRLPNDEQMKYDEE